ncbi:AAA family ATPase [Rhodoblastus sp. 17X3]|uniref:AAA family ATPase n=1 Tax=Rhodoblastus sp. 17X3 TaxID=3047026 RepID=UPI00406C2813
MAEQAKLYHVRQIDAPKRTFVADSSDSSSETSPQVTLIRGSTIKPEPIAWIWRGWLARGKTHILGGQPGTGKTTLAISIAAIVTSGGEFPDGSRCITGNVVIPACSLRRSPGANSWTVRRRTLPR